MSRREPRQAGTFAASVRCEVPALHTDLEVQPGRTLGVIGPNGAGKSTLLGILAGLRRTPESQIRSGDRVLQAPGTFVDAHRRSVVLLEQQGKLFPHLSVARNVGFGPAAMGLPRRETATRVDYWLDAVGVSELAGRMPSSLSGGQAQRVAIARALATEPDVLLLDEPFAALDVDVAQQMRTLMRGLLAQREGASILVTHDLVDVVSLADRLAVLDEGRLAQYGATEEVLAHPETPFVASLAAVNLVVGRFDGSAVAAEGIAVVGTPSGPIAAGEPAAAAFSPRAVALYLAAPQGSPRNSWEATVSEILPRGDHALVRAESEGRVLSAEVTWDAVRQLEIGAGSVVSLVVKASEVRIYRAASAD